MTPIADASSPQQIVDGADAPLPWESIETAETDREQEVTSQESDVREEEEPSLVEAPVVRSPRRLKPGMVEPDPGFRVPATAGLRQGSGFSEEEADRCPLAPSRGAGWTIPLLCAGIGLIACCLIIPQTDVNRRLAYQKKSLEQDLASIQNQAQVNDEFLKRVSDDPGLAERLAQRQMNIVREGSQVWRDPGVETAASISPFELVNVPRPAPLPAYQPVGGWFAGVCRDPHSNLYLTGAALMMLAAGLVMGLSPRKDC